MSARWWEQTRIRDGLKGGAASGYIPPPALRPAPAPAVNNARRRRGTSAVRLTSAAAGAAPRRTMWPLLACALLQLLAGQTTSVIATKNTPVFPKCCPDGQGLVRETDEFLNKSYTCVDHEQVESNYSVVVPPLVIGRSIPVRYGFPENCDDFVITEVTGDILQGDSDCYDRLALDIINGTLKSSASPAVVMLTCAERTGVSGAYPIHHIRKCCPNGQEYDTEYHMCRNTGDVDGEQRLVQRFDPRGVNVYAIEHGLFCKSEEYAVEVQEGGFSLLVEGSTLHVGSGGAAPALRRGEWCGEARGGRLLARVCTRDCRLYDAFCMRKCCPVGYHYLPRHCATNISDCVPNEDDTTPFNLSSYLDPLTRDSRFNKDAMGFRSSLRCAKGKFMLDRTFDWYQLASSGQLLTTAALGGPLDQYCIETFDRRPCGHGITVDPLICFVDSTKKDFNASSIALSISCVFLLLTLVVYLALPELRNLHGRTLICHVSMMLLAYCCLVSVQRARIENTVVCTMLGYGMYFGFVSAFAWLNVMCLDIWWTFGSVRSVQPMRRAGAERRRFAWYSLAAWGASVSLTGAMLLLDLYPVADVLDANIGNNSCWFGSCKSIFRHQKGYCSLMKNKRMGASYNEIAWYSLAAWGASVSLTGAMLLLDLYPVADVLDANIGNNSCWFGSLQNSSTDWPHYIFFVIPMGLVSCVNFVLWVLTARHCHRVKAEVHRFQAGSAGDRAKFRFRADHARYTLTVKLWVVMGATWVWETVSTMLSEPRWLWGAVDLVNELQGVSIFIILVMKPKLYYLIRKKLGLEKPDANKNGTSSTARTSSTFLSRTISTEERALQRVSQPVATKNKD
ncbi:hypothetical protein JYU34_002657 [Plutella xylostella]|uniref:G-protein coupled receptors family 2 profile 2 domain-containing protein n=1 Tax=Plutella xylostella TaxID=51655 RepID=A0ABQ7R2Y5_PLUXY|nr:hypothetical protein JYU34_002657 [Plutella xylostella]